MVHASCLELKGKYVGSLNGLGVGENFRLQAWTAKAASSEAATHKICTIINKDITF